MTTLLNSRLQNTAIFMYKIKNKLLPVNILEIFPGATTAFGPFLWSKLPQKNKRVTVT